CSKSLVNLKQSWAYIMSVLILCLITLASLRSVKRSKKWGLAYLLFAPLVTAIVTVIPIWFLERLFIALFAFLLVQRDSEKIKNKSVLLFSILMCLCVLVVSFYDRQNHNRLANNDMKTFFSDIEAFSTRNSSETLVFDRFDYPLFYHDAYRPMFIRKVLNLNL